MFYEDEERDYKLLAPHIDELVSFCDSHLFNEVLIDSANFAAIEPLFRLLEPLAPIKCNSDAKEIWIKVPRGTLEDYCYGEELDSETFREAWLRYYPDEFKWYRLFVAKYVDQDGSVNCFVMRLNQSSVISAVKVWRSSEKPKYFEEKDFEKLCELLTPAVEQSVKLLKEGKYNEYIEKELPYKCRVGVIKRCDLWRLEPKYKDEVYGNLSEDKIIKLKRIIESGENDRDRIGRIKDFTANDFFKACKLGYEAIGHDCEGASLPELYIRYSDRRDEGLTGLGVNPYHEPGIAFDDPKAWDEWYFHRKQRDSGHPFEVAPGYYHLYVWQDKEDSEMGGYYFDLGGSTNYPNEVISSYLAIRDAGFPIFFPGGEGFIDSFEGSDYIGIVPIQMSEYECAEFIPDEYENVGDYVNADEIKDNWVDKITWLPESSAELIQ